MTTTNDAQTPAGSWAYDIAPQPSAETGTASDWSTYHLVRARAWQLLTGSLWPLPPLAPERIEGIEFGCYEFALSYLLDHVTDDVARNLASIMEAGDVADEITWDHLKARGIDPDSVRRWDTRAETEQQRIALLAQRHRALDSWASSSAYGCQVLDIGENGEMLVLGHPGTRRALAAMNAHMRTVIGDSFAYGDPITYAEAAANVQQLHVIPVAPCPTHRASHGAPQRGCRECMRTPIPQDDDAELVHLMFENCERPDTIPVTRYAR